MRPIKVLLVCLLAAAYAAGCSQPDHQAPEGAAAPANKAHGPEEHTHDEPGHGDDENDHDHDDAHDHHHEAPRGGTLIMLGDHLGHFEILQNTETGELTAYALDGHAEQPVRLAAPYIAVTIRPEGGQDLALTLDAVENPLTGETVGDTSEFRGQAEELKSLQMFSIMFPELDFRGVQLPPFSSPFPDGNE